MTMRLMFFICNLFLALQVTSSMAAGTGTVYKVGDDYGWTHDLNYTLWTNSKTFRVGDTIRFEYRPDEYNNVMQVIQLHYRTCNGTVPLTKYITGNDSITFNKRGHYYFVCGNPRHCIAGQKVDIKVVRPSVGPVTSASTSAWSLSSAVSISPYGSEGNESLGEDQSNTNSSSEEESWLGLVPNVVVVAFVYFVGALGVLALGIVLGVALACCMTIIKCCRTIIRCCTWPR